MLVKVMVCSMDLHTDDFRAARGDLIFSVVMCERQY